uniref:Uncharacterized protein n=1 Tax=Arion vulgaris TaxID=1028688 RepID=A0A0B7AM43_9EUPU
MLFYSDLLSFDFFSPHFILKLNPTIPKKKEKNISTSDSDIHAVFFVVDYVHKHLVFNPSNRFVVQIIV